MRKPSNFRLSPEALRLLTVMSQAEGISRTAMLEIAIREAAKKEVSPSKRRVRSSKHGQGDDDH